MGDYEEKGSLKFIKPIIFVFFTTDTVHSYCHYTIHNFSFICWHKRHGVLVRFFGLLQIYNKEICRRPNLNNYLQIVRN